jgi:hypothetical protein
MVACLCGVLLVASVCVRLAVPDLLSQQRARIAFVVCFIMTLLLLLLLLWQDIVKHCSSANKKLSDEARFQLLLCSAGAGYLAALSALGRPMTLGEANMVLRWRRRQRCWGAQLLARKKRQERVDRRSKPPGSSTK